MKTWVRRTTGIGILAAGFLLAGTTAANADTAVSAGNQGVVNGTQVNVPVQVPINGTGNGVGVLGGGVGSSQGSAAVANHGDESARTEDALGSAGNQGILNGNQVNVPIQVPINVTGNGVGVAGVGVGSSQGSASVAHHGESARTEDALGSAGNQGILDGNQFNVPVQVPANVTGNGVGVAGVGVGSSQGSAAVAKHGDESARTEDALGSAGNQGVGNGNQFNVPIQVPLNVTGNGVGVLGLGVGSSQGSAAVANHGDESARTEDALGSAGNQGIANGNQANVPIQVPVNVCGNGVGVLGVGVGSGKDCAAVASHGDKDGMKGGYDYDREHHRGGYGYREHHRGGYRYDHGTSSIATEAAEKGRHHLKPAKAAKPAKPAKADKPLQSVMPAMQAAKPAAKPVAKPVAKADKPAADTTKPAKAAPMGDRDGDRLASVGNTGIGNGNQANVPVQVPVNFTGNGVGVLGVGVGSSAGSAAVASHDG